MMGSRHMRVIGLGWGAECYTGELTMKPGRKACVGSVSRGLGELRQGGGSRRQPRRGWGCLELNSILHSEHCR